MDRLHCQSSLILLTTVLREQRSQTLSSPENVLPHGRWADVMHGGDLLGRDAVNESKLAARALHGR
jgi:hypothetical protein